MSAPCGQCCTLGRCNKRAAMRHARTWSVRGGCGGCGCGRSVRLPVVRIRLDCHLVDDHVSALSHAHVCPSALHSSSDSWHCDQSKDSDEQRRTKRKIVALRSLRATMHLNQWKSVDTRVQSDWDWDGCASVYDTVNCPGTWSSAVGRQRQGSDSDRGEAASARRPRSDRLHFCTALHCTRRAAASSASTRP